MRRMTKMDLSHMTTFHNWLFNVGEQFLSLSEEERNQSLDYILELCGSFQLLHLTKALPLLLYRDFLNLLPLELSTSILKHLDAASLLNCSLVSRHWYKLINTCTEVWRLQCQKLGVRLPLLCIQDAGYYKKLYLRTAAAQLGPLKSGEAFKCLVLRGHSSRVMAVHYRNGKLATGSDDHTVKIWDNETGQCLHVIRTHTVCDLKFDDNYIYTASFDSTAACWDINGEVSQRFIGHISAVFSIDVCPEMSLLVTGSADLTVKLWALGSGHLLTSLSGYHGDWIIKVKLLFYENESRYTVVSTDKRSCCIWRLTTEHEVDNIQLVRHSDFQIIPHLLFEDKIMRICFLADDAKEGFIASYVLHPELTFLGRISLPQNVFPVRFLLGVGDKFAVVTSSGHDSDGLSIFSLELQEVIATQPLPAIRPTTGGTSVTFGPSEWLDGFTERDPSGLILAACRKDNTIYVLQWKSPDSFFHKQSSNEQPNYWNVDQG